MQLTKLKKKLNFSLTNRLRIYLLITIFIFVLFSIIDANGLTREDSGEKEKIGFRFIRANNIMHKHGIRGSVCLLTHRKTSLQKKNYHSALHQVLSYSTRKVQQGLLFHILYVGLFYKISHHFTWFKDIGLFVSLCLLNSLVYIESYFPSNSKLESILYISYTSCFNVNFIY